MDGKEIALQLTLKALDKGNIKFYPYGAEEKNAIMDVNSFNAQQVCDFYNNVLNRLNSQK